MTFFDTSVIVLAVAQVVQFYLISSAEDRAQLLEDRMESLEHEHHYTNTLIGKLEERVEYVLSVLDKDKGAKPEEKQTPPKPVTPTKPKKAKRRH